MHAEALSVSEARDILDLWEKTPKSYSDFLRNRGCFTFVSAYTGLNEDQDHKFYPTAKRVLAPTIAEKFFRLKNDDISIRLIDFITTLLSHQDADIPICAFPYLNQACVQYMSREFIMEMFLNALFVFNFEDDAEGTLFEMMRQKVDGEQEEELLAANSFNIEGWISASRDKKKTVKLFLMSSHFIPRGSDEEASFRKLFLRYIYDVQEGMRRYREQTNREQGIITN